MRTIRTVTQSTQFPKFWNEEWLKIAINELDSRKLTPNEKASFEILVARNAEAVNEEICKKKQSVKIALMKGKLSIEDIADIVDVSIDFVLDVQKQMTNS
jgi:hypothetical protein